MTQKTTIQAPVAMIQQDAGGPSPQELAARWREARLAYPLYEALALQFQLASPPYPPGEQPPARPTRDTFDRDMKWLDALDEKTMAFQLRQLAPEILNGNKESLRALVQRQLRKPDKTNSDRDKIDLLLVQYFALCASEEEDLIHKEITLADVARVLTPVLPQADPTPLAWCAPLEEILDKTKHCHSLRDLMEDGLVEQGRMLKDTAGPMFYDPAALVAFCRRAIAQKTDVLLIEGIGGVMVPLDDRHTVLDWMTALDLPAILVVGNYLGTISHTLTALDAMARRGVKISTVVVSETSAGTPLEDNARTIARFAEEIEVLTLPRLSKHSFRHPTFVHMTERL